MRFLLPTPLLHALALIDDAMCSLDGLVLAVLVLGS
jgi:hypothetical protein